MKVLVFLPLVLAIYAGSVRADGPPNASIKPMLAQKAEKMSWEEVKAAYENIQNQNVGLSHLPAFPIAFNCRLVSNKNKVKAVQIYKDTNRRREKSGNRFIPFMAVSPADDPQTFFDEIRVHEESKSFNQKPITLTVTIPEHSLASLGSKLKDKLMIVAEKTVSFLANNNQIFFKVDVFTRGYKGQADETKYGYCLVPILFD